MKTSTDKNINAMQKSRKGDSQITLLDVDTTVSLVFSHEVCGRKSMYTLLKFTQAA